MERSKKEWELLNELRDTIFNNAIKYDLKYDCIFFKNYKLPVNEKYKIWEKTYPLIGTIGLVGKEPLFLDPYVISYELSTETLSWNRYIACLDWEEGKGFFEDEKTKIVIDSGSFLEGDISSSKEREKALQKMVDLVNSNPDYRYLLEYENCLPFDGCSTKHII